MAADCKTLEKRTIEAVELLGLHALIEKVTDYPSIAPYGVMSTPALVIDEQVIFSGRVPRVGELKTTLTGAKP